MWHINYGPENKGSWYRGDYGHSALTTRPRGTVDHYKREERDGGEILREGRGIVTGEVSGESVTHPFSHSVPNWRK